MIPSGQRPRSAAPQTRPQPAPRRPPPDPYPPPSLQQQYDQPASQHAYRQPLPTQYEGEDDTFMEAQAAAAEYRPPPPQYYTSPSTPMPAAPRRRAAEPYVEMNTPQQPHRRPAEAYPDHGTPRSTPSTARRGSAAPSEASKGTASTQLLALYNKLDSKVGDLVDDSRTMRDAAHDIKQTISALPSREEVKEDQAESLIQPLAQVQADMNKSIKEMLQDSQHDLLKQLVEQQRKQVEEQLQPIKEELAQMRATLAKPPSNPAPRTDKTTQALQGALIASLRSVDELKDALLPLNLEKTLPQVFGLANHLNVVHNKIDHVTVNTRGLPAVQQVQQSILERIVQVHARTASQELTGQKQIELSVKFGDKLSSLEADSLANAQALNAIGKEVEKQAEAARDAALRRQNAVDQSTQTNTPSIYANVNKQGGVDGLQHGHTLALESPVSSNSRFPPAFVDSPSAVEDLFDSRFPSSQGTSRSPQCSSTIVEDPQTVAPPVQLPIPRPVGPVKIKLRRRAPANKVTTPLIQEAPALNSPSKADDEAASDPSSSSLIPFGAASDPPSKKRKSPKPSEVPTSTMAAPRRTTRQRKTPVRWGQTPAPDGDDYIVLGTQPPTRPCRPIAPLPKKSKGKRKGKGKPKMIEPKVEVEDPLASTGLLIDLSTDSTYDNGDNGDESGLSIPSTTADSSTLHPSLSSIQSDPLPASHPSVVMETCLPASSAIEPLHITRSATSNLDGLTRQAFLAAPDERVESDGEATEEDDDQNPEG